MTLNWDFTNYTFSFLVSLVGSVLGICYPLFLDSIRKIDEQYKSTVLASYFQRAFVFKLYKFVLMVAIIVSFVAPFIMLLSDCYILNIFVEAIHCICVLGLVMVMLHMFRTMQTFCNPRELCSYLFDDIDPKNPKRDHDLLLCALDLMRYTSKRPNPEVYRKSKEYIIRVAFSEQMPVKYKFYNLSQDLQDVLIVASDYATDEHVKPLCYDNLLSQIVYNNFAKGYNGDLNYSTVWRSLCRMMDSNNNEWFQQYWSGAVQYYTFVIKNAPSEEIDNNDGISNEKRFLELHHVLGGMLVYHKKYDWLKFVLTHDHVSPPHFYLVPSTFDEIIDVIANVEKQQIVCWSLTSKYQMNGLFNDIDSDYRIISLVYSYCALLIIRLFVYNDYNIRYKDPMTAPSIDSLSLDDLNGLKRIAERLRNDVVNYWYADDIIERLHLNNVPSVTSVTSLIDGFISKINAQINYHIDNPELDTAKFEELKLLLAEMDKNSPSITEDLSDEERNAWIKSEVAISIEQQIDANLCSKDGYRGWSNFPDVLIHMLRNKIKAYLDGNYSLLTPAADLLVCERNVFIALEKLQIPEGYTILAMGVYLGGIDMKFNTTPKLKYNIQNSICHYGNTPVIERNSSMSAIFIIKSDELLKIETTTELGTFFSSRGMKPLKDSNNVLYTNIDKIIKDSIPTPIIIIGKNVNLYIKQNIKFIRIRVKHDGDDTGELARMSKLTGYIS